MKAKLLRKARELFPIHYSTRTKEYTVYNYWDDSESIDLEKCVTKSKPKAFKEARKSILHYARYKCPKECDNTFRKIYPPS